MWESGCWEMSQYRSRGWVMLDVSTQTRKGCEVNVEIQNCGKCAGCERDAGIRAVLAEIDEHFLWRAAQMKVERDRLGYRDSTERRQSKELRWLWEERKMEAIRIMRPIGCLQPFVVTSDST